MTDPKPAEVKVAAIISDDEITRVHGRGNFGSMSPREVVNDGVRKAALGYHSGHTQFCILREHGLITAPRGMSHDYSLTKKGKKYARALMHDLLFRPASPPAETGEGWSDADLEDLLSDAIGDSIDMDWTYRDGAKAIMAALKREGLSLSAQPVSPSEGEAVAWRWRAKDYPSEAWQLSGTLPGPKFNSDDWYSVQPLYTHPASDQSDTDRMRAALEPFANAFASFTDGDGTCVTAGEWEAIRNAVSIEDFRRAALAEKAADK